MEIKLDPRLAGLGTEKLNDLIAEYEAREAPVKDLLKKYGLADKIRPSELVSLFPYIPTGDGKICPFCGKTYLRKVHARAANYESYRCPECGHVEGYSSAYTPIKRCDCRNCREARRAKREVQIEQIRKLSGNPR